VGFFTDHNIRIFRVFGDDVCSVEISDDDVDIGVSGVELGGGRAEEGGDVEGGVLVDDCFEEAATDVASCSGATIVNVSRGLRDT
jgi:hypothetical protein